MRACSELSYAFAMATVPLHNAHDSFADTLASLVIRQTAAPRGIAIGMPARHAWARTFPNEPNASIARIHAAASQLLPPSQHGSPPALHVKVYSHDFGPALKLLVAWAALRRWDDICAAIVVDDDLIYSDSLAQTYLSAHEPFVAGSRAPEALTRFADQHLRHRHPVRVPPSRCPMVHVQGADSYMVPAALMRAVRRGRLEAAYRWAPWPHTVHALATGSVHPPHATLLTVVCVLHVLQVGAWAVRRDVVPGRLFGRCSLPLRALSRAIRGRLRQRVGAAGADLPCASDSGATSEQIGAAARDAREPR